MFIHEKEFSAAYNKGSPIRIADGLGKIETIPLQPERIEFIKNNFWYHENTDFSECINKDEKCGHRMPELRKKLLSFGGEETCLPVIESDLLNILERGQLWLGDRVTLIEGRPSRCHENSSILWHKNKNKYVLCTGYALSPDGLWRQHSWCVQLNPKKNRIIETTVKRLAYFGFVMNDEEARKFLIANYY